MVPPLSLPLSCTQEGDKKEVFTRKNERNRKQRRERTLTLLAFCLTITTYLCTIPFATSLLATFKSKFASPAEEPSNFTFPTDAALTQNFDVALVVVVAEEVAVLLFKDWPLKDAHKLCACVVDAVKDILRARVSTSIGVSVQKVTTKSVRSLGVGQTNFFLFFLPFPFF